MVKKLWSTPVYELPNRKGEIIKINVTHSVSAGLEAKSIIFDVMDFFKKHNVNSILDFGAGSLRHCFPFLQAGFSVCAVEFEEQFTKNRPKCAHALISANQDANFSNLLFPREFITDKRKFDAILLCYVLNVMPIPAERIKVVDFLVKKLQDGGFLLYMAQWGNTKDLDMSKTVSDGFYKGSAKNTFKTFYKETRTADTHAFFKTKKMRHIKSYGNNGNEQVFLYRKEKKIWV